jgi:S1-C subfamily serine protease
MILAAVTVSTAVAVARGEKAPPTAGGATANLAMILAQARCVPELESGRPSGYRCFEIQPGSVYDKLGLEDNDVITRVDGAPLDNPAVAFAKLNAASLGTHEKLTLTIRRGGRTITKTFGGATRAKTQRKQVNP